MRTPAAAVSPFLALSALLLLVVTSVAEKGYGGGDAPAGANGYGGRDDASPGPKGDGGYQVPAYQKAVDGLDAGYYRKSCPDMEGIVQKAVRKALRDDYTLAASLIRLFFHDFAVRVRTPPPPLPAFILRSQSR
jgi:peroxidase